MTIEQIKAIALRKMSGQTINGVETIDIDLFLEFQETDQPFPFPLYRCYLITYRQLQPGNWIVENVVPDKRASQ